MSMLIFQAFLFGQSLIRLWRVLRTRHNSWQ